MYLQFFVNFVIFFIEKSICFSSPIFAGSDTLIYKASLAAAEKLIGSIQIPLLKLALSMHTMSPRVQAHFQIANEILEHGDCNTNTFVTIGTRVACSLDELEKGLKKIVANKASGDEDDEDVHSFDHIYPGSENNTVTTILYSDIGSKEFETFHEYLAKQADDGAIKYIIRHFIRVSLTTHSFSSFFSSIECECIFIVFNRLILESGTESSAIIRLRCRVTSKIHRI